MILNLNRKPVSLVTDGLHIRTVSVGLSPVDSHVHTIHQSSTPTTQTQKVISHNVLRAQRFSCMSRVYLAVMTAKLLAIQLPTQRRLRSPF